MTSMTFSIAKGWKHFSQDSLNALIFVIILQAVVSSNAINAISPKSSEFASNDIQNSSCQDIHNKVVTLNMEFVVLVPELRLDFSDYLIPLVKRMNFDDKENFIFVSGHYIENDLDKSEKNNIGIFITLSFCGMRNDYAERIMKKEFQVALLDGVPVIFENFSFDNLISKTDRSFEWRKWRMKNPLNDLMTCDSEAYFELEADGDRIYYWTCLDDFGLIGTENIKIYLPSKGWLKPKNK